MMERRPALVFFPFLTFALIIRFHSFIPITLDRDEATYAVFADHLLNGFELYKDVQDIKPPGIFLIYSGIQLVFGKSLIAIRFMSALVVAATGFLLYCFKRRWGLSFESSLLSGFILILMFNYFFGLSGNTELYFVWFFALGLLAFKKALTWKGYFVSGLLIGIGFIVKQHIAFDFAALGLFFLFVSIKQHSFWKNFIPMAVMVAGFVLPYALVHLYFYSIGNWEYYHHITYVIPGNYAASHHLETSLKFNLTALLMYLPALVIAILTWRLMHVPVNFKILIALLLAFDLVAINLTGKPFKHYLLQLVIPLSLLAGEGYHLKFLKKLFQANVFYKTSAVLMVCYAICLSVIYKNYRFDSGKELVQYFDNRIEPDDTLFAADSPSILYWFFDKRSPTKYVHPTLTVFPYHIKELGIDIKNELGGILKQKPTYIVVSDRYPHSWFLDELTANYDLKADVEKYKVYKIGK